MAFLQPVLHQLKKTAPVARHNHRFETEAPQKPWHTMATDEVCRALDTNDKTGLTEEAVLERRRRYGENVLPEKKPASLVMIFLHQFKNPLIYILLAAGLVAALMGDFKDAAFIFLVLLINAVLGTTQEWRAEKSAEALQKLLRSHALVKRNGTRQDVIYNELVPGDIIYFESGNRITADTRLLDVKNLEADESLLTGESLPVQKQVKPLPDPQLPVSDRSNMVFAGSTIHSGRGKGVVVATGIRSQIGRIAESVFEAEKAQTPLLVRMESFTRRVGFVMLIAAAVLGAVAVLRGMTVMEGFFLAVALAVSAIPEGLPVAITIALSIASRRMASRNVIVRKLAAVEGLGSCTYIVSDKTGTLTVNKQTVKQVVLPDGESFQVTGEGYNGAGHVTTQDGDAVDETAASALRRLAAAGVICNEGQLQYDSRQQQWVHQGDAVDIALLGLSFKLEQDPEAVRQAVEKTGEIPYESERRYAAVFYRHRNQHRVAVKGAAETVLPFCHTILALNGETTMDRPAMENMAQQLAAQGYRVLVIAEGHLADPPPSEQELHESALPTLTLLGFTCLIDPLRPEAREAIQRCREAGIEVAMVTGDHPATALAIAKNLDLAANSDQVVTGQELEPLEPGSPEFRKIVRRRRIFARVSPVQKLHIVSVLIDLGHFVAVTGDGVNDAPALRKAHIGVAMGSGSDVAKDTAAIIVTDDNFATIEAGVEEGRVAYDNIRKVTWFLISTGLAEIMIFMLALFFNTPLPLLPVQILWINLVTSGLQDVGLAFEAGEHETMKLPPRNPAESIFNRTMIEQTLVTGIPMGLMCFGAWYWFLQNGYDEAAARNMTILFLVLLENFHALNCRSEFRSVFSIPLQNNLFLLGGIALATLVQLAAMHTPLFQNLLSVQPVPLEHWLYLFFISGSILFIVDIYKRFRHRYEHPLKTADD